MLSDKQIVDMIEVQEKKAKKLADLKEAIWQLIEANEEACAAQRLIPHLKYLLKCHQMGDPYPIEDVFNLTEERQQLREQIKAQELDALMNALKPYFEKKAESVLQTWLLLDAPKTDV